MKRRHVVKHPFRATFVETGEGRTFNANEWLRWHPEDPSDPVIFEADLFQFKADRAEFLKSVELLYP